MIAPYERRDSRGQAPLRAGFARALAILLVTAAFLLAPLVAAVGKPQSVTTLHVAQVVSSPMKASQGCPKKSLPGQPNACSGSSASVAGFEDRSAALAPVAARSSLAPRYDLTLTTQCCGAPPDRPPRFAA